MRDSSTHLEPLAVDIPEACRLTGLGRSKLYELLSAGEIPSVKVGKRRVVPIEGGRQREPHLEPVLAVMPDCGVALVLVNKHEKAFRSSRYPHIRRGDTDRTLGLAAFHQPPLWRLFPASASTTVIGSATQRTVCALSTAPVVLTRRYAAILETRFARGIPCIELVTKAVPGLPLLISAAKRRGMTRAGTGDLYTPTRKVQEAITGRETEVAVHAVLMRGGQL